MVLLAIGVYAVRFSQAAASGLTGEHMGVDLKRDPTFFDRADSFIHLANDHCASIGRGKVSASFMYGCARFQAWNAATWSETGDEMKARREETLKYFLDQYHAMLEEHLDEYIANHAKYMKAGQ